MLLITAPKVPFLNKVHTFHQSLLCLHPFPLPLRDQPTSKTAIKPRNEAKVLGTHILGSQTSVKCAPNQAAPNPEPKLHAPQSLLTQRNSRPPRRAGGRRKTIDFVWENFMLVLFIISRRVMKSSKAKSITAMLVKPRAALQLASNRQLSGGESGALRATRLGSLLSIKLSCQP